MSLERRDSACIPGYDRPWQYGAPSLASCTPRLVLIPVMRDGNRLEVACQDPASSVRNAQARFLAARAHLPEHIPRIVTAEPTYPVSYSARLEPLSGQARNSF